ncbi:MAG TPA: dihydrolipoyl dehydrogenase [Kofleriaceae bacterium]|nr:dihydrolipoyl dehydrogenase [Kofleriaceae bacterium]
MTAPQTYDVCVIGSGPGGYVAAIRAAQLGLSTACIERESLGGVCLNWGCIPTKALLRSAEILELCHRAGEFGVGVTGITADFSAMVERSRGISRKISKGVAYLFRKNKVDHIQGTARLLGAGRIAVTTGAPGSSPKAPGHPWRGTGDAGEQTVAAKNIIVATGARARSLPGIELDGDVVIAYREALTLPALPGSMIILGAGAIGVEFASFYRSLGTEVTIVEYMPTLVPNEDADIAAELARAFKKRGIKALTKKKVTRAKVAGGRVTVDIEPAAGGPSETLSADKLLVAVGVTGNIEDLGLEALGIGTSRGTIEVDQSLQTAVRGIYAIGDVIGAPALAHVASAEGVFVAEHIAGHSPHPVPYDAVPACTYCHPEIASVGLTEEKARAQGIAIKVGKFPFGPLGKTMAAGEYPGLVKFIWDENSGALVGAHMIGPAVTDLIASPTLAKTTEVNAESFIHTIFAHPTFAEAMKEAAEDATGMAIHI